MLGCLERLNSQPNTGSLPSELPQSPSGRRYKAIREPEATPSAYRFAELRDRSPLFRSVGAQGPHHRCGNRPHRITQAEEVANLGRFSSPKPAQRPRTSPPTPNRWGPPDASVRIAIRL